MDDREETGAKTVFVSYDREASSRDFVATLKEELEKNGFTVLFETEDIPEGSDCVDSIGRGLRGSTFLVAVVTDAYLASPRCSRELLAADTDSKPVFPVVLEDVDLQRTEERSPRVCDVISGLSWTFFRPEVDNFSGSLGWLVQRMSEKVTASSAVDSWRQGSLSTVGANRALSDWTIFDVVQPHSLQPWLPQPHHPHHLSGFPMQSLFPGDRHPLDNDAAEAEVTGNADSAPSHHASETGACRPTSASARGPSPASPRSPFRVGLRLEAVDRRFPYYVCVATIVDSKDNGDLQIHFDGWGPEYDYWCHSDDIELHPVGWCSQHSYELYPAQGVEWKGWDSYLTDTQSEGADSSYFNVVQLAPPGSLLFRPGMRLEAVDPANPAQIRVATVKAVNDDGARLLVHFDGWGDERDFWCSPNSPDIHPAMWCGKHRKSVQKPRGHEGDFRWSRYLADPDVNPAPAHCFTKEQLGAGQERRGQPMATVAGLFEVGMKLEAKDRKHPGLICVATVTEIQGNRLLIHFDGWTKYYDYWCDPDTTDIHPVGWCRENGRDLQKPQGFAGRFSWDAYLQQTGAFPAPPNAFTQAQLRNYSWF